MGVNIGGKEKTDWLVNYQGSEGHGKARISADNRIISIVECIQYWFCNRRMFILGTSPTDSEDSRKL
jgi:hypothetical protein